ncbi:MAG: M20 family metallopeptidase [Bacillota bacterium]
MKRRVSEHLDRISQRLYDISDWLYQNPEVGLQEIKASTRYAQELEKEGFTVERGLAGMPTSIKATYSTGPGPTFGFLAEYDALPGIGHGCGHNIIGAASFGAALAVKELLADHPGTVIFFGTPAEETVGGKIAMAEAGCFAGVDAAMIVHPGVSTRVGGTSLASHPMQITFKGKTAHAAAAPHMGVNALDAMIMTFVGLRSLKMHLRDDVRLPGIITHGGDAPNVIPDKAVARFSIRAADVEYLEEVLEKVRNVARGCAMAVGAGVEFYHYEPLFKDMRNNELLSQLFKANMESLGEPVAISDGKPGGSTDMGNVSHEVPSIHPSVAIGSPDFIRGHSIEMAQATISEAGHRGLLLAAKAMAMTAADLVVDPTLLARAKDEFEVRMGRR